MSQQFRNNRRSSGAPIIKGAAGAKTAEVWIPENQETPTVETEVDQGIVQAITVRCPCGCVTELVCEYQ